jgi:hypothetical protein
MELNLVAELSEAAGVTLHTPLKVLIERIMRIQDLGAPVPTPLALLVIVKADKEGVSLFLCTHDQQLKIITERLR